VGITVISVFRELGIEPVPAVTWSVGARVRDLYEQRFGREPPKDLRPKTAGGGSHCFAIYPASWRNEIAEIIRQHKTEQDRQTRFDF
jgi:hypothetical protein